jgi:hypothetical protein
MCTKQLANELRVSLRLQYNGNNCLVLEYKYKHDQSEMQNLHAESSK